MFPAPDLQSVTSLLSTFYTVILPMQFIVNELLLLILFNNGTRNILFEQTDGIVTPYKGMYCCDYGKNHSGSGSWRGRGWNPRLYRIVQNSKFEIKIKYTMDVDNVNSFK